MLILVLEECGLNIDTSIWEGVRDSNKCFRNYLYYIENLYDCSRMLRAIMNKSWKQHPTKHQQYGHQPLISQTIQNRRTRYEGHCRRSKDELISNVLLWTSSHGRATKIYLQQVYMDTRCSLEDLPEAMDDRDEWRERERERERESRKSVLSARHDDDEENDVKCKC